MLIKNVLSKQHQRRIQAELYFIWKQMICFHKCMYKETLLELKSFPQFNLFNVHWVYFSIPPAGCFLANMYCTFCMLCTLKRDFFPIYLRIWRNKMSFVFQENGNIPVLFNDTLKIKQILSQFVCIKDVYFYILLLRRRNICRVIQPTRDILKFRGPFNLFQYIRNSI